MGKLCFVWMSRVSDDAQRVGLETLVSRFLNTTIDYASHSYETCAREQKNLKLKKPRTESLQKTVYYRAGLAWNTVPGDLRLCTSRLQFKKKVKDFYLKRLM